MEIRDPVHGSIDIPPNVEAVIDSPVFQRLRSIKQLGFGEFSFPGGTHNRFIHSVGAHHLAGLIFDNIFKGYAFSNTNDKWRLRECTILGALLHDVGHGPLSHTSEEVMPQLEELKIPVYKNKKNRKATHEDYTIKFITDSELSQVICDNFSNIQPIHIAAIIDKNLELEDDFFSIDGINFRPILSQIISSELDADRMDYLVRDSYFTGASYGQVDLSWLIQNLSYHKMGETLSLALNRKALYTFDDFLISRHHMYLQVYFHHKAIIYDEMLLKYLTSNECDFFLPANINEYTNYTDFNLYEHLRASNNYWAKRISQRKPFKVVFELHTMTDSLRTQHICTALEAAGIATIASNSQTRLSKYHATSPEEHQIHQIFVIDHLDSQIQPIPIEETTKIFQMYEGTRRVERIYVPREDFKKADQIIKDQQL